MYSNLIIYSPLNEIAGNILYTAQLGLDHPMQTIPPRKGVTVTGYNPMKFSNWKTKCLAHGTENCRFIQYIGNNVSVALAKYRTTKSIIHYDLLLQNHWTKRVTPYLKHLKNHHLWEQ
jgi:hypothetical protein